MALQISSNFDAGNIEVVDASNSSAVRLRIRLDAGGEHMQWFHFRVTGAQGVPCRFVIENAGQCSYPKAWEGYRACRSTDRARWRRVETRYASGALTIEDTPPGPVVWYSYFAPYSLERLADRTAEWAARARVERLGPTVDGRDLDRLTVGEGPRVVWVIARQHPGEAMASWWMEGFLGRLLDGDDPLARRLLARATFHVVPHMNPDGSFRGHLRCNAVGANLNREWHAPSTERSPEVLWVRDAMDASGVDLCLDVHGDEELPYNFISGAEGIPGWTARMASLEGDFCEAYERANPDFQRVHGYPPTAPGAANMTICSNQIAQRFDCLSMTLEMPFKDNDNAPDPEHGWSPGRCIRLGASSLDAIDAVVGSLRDQG
jgi:murein tripeptide amidase MpaA